MKKSMLALAVLGSFASVAAAQSSVTLFGVVDLSLLSVKNSGGSQKLMQNNSYNSNRLGFRGTEDLGGGLKANFWLEAGMANDIGNAGNLQSTSISCTSTSTTTPITLVTTTTTACAQPNTTATQGTASSTKFFGRRSYVSLEGAFGEVRLGREYTPQFWTTTIFDSFGTNGPGSSLNISAAAANGLGTFAGTFVRADNSIEYNLPTNLGGLYGQVMVSAGENTTLTNGFNKHTSFRFGWAAGPVNVAVAAGSTKVAAGQTFKMSNIGGSFNAGFATFKGYYNVSKASVNGRKENLLHLGMNMPLGQSEVRVGFTRSDEKGTGFDTIDANQFAVGYIYNLSKRTALYTDYSRVSNKAGANFTIGAGAPNALGKSSRGIDFGVRHAF